ncbi:hypothetical protein [Sphingomonas fuzhouensis]|uniref:hypothetical protein n=1 Tax=Sphingomonas fuzhouensis TaxID=3106033 RepID=UPI002AFF73E4|nr:hypothetical protein [Sphingomonas sp. SGZ-02]
MASIVSFPLLAVTALLFAAPSEIARPRIPNAMVTLFRCTSDHRLTLTPDGEDETGPKYAVSARVPDKRAIALAVGRADHRLYLLLGQGRGAQRYVLHDVRQGSSPGSGAGGRADSFITGTSGSQTFLLYAGYDNNGEEFGADLRITGRANRVFACDDRIYRSPSVFVLGTKMPVNIYTLAYEGLAEALAAIPDLPDNGSPMNH